MTFWALKLNLNNSISYVLCITYIRHTNYSIAKLYESMITRYTFMNSYILYIWLGMTIRVNTFYANLITLYNNRCVKSYNYVMTNFIFFFK